MRKKSSIQPINNKFFNEGYYTFRLKKIIDNKKISINKFSEAINTDYKVLKRLMEGDLVKLDMEVMSRICDYLNCGIEDIVEYFPNNELKK